MSDYWIPAEWNAPKNIHAGTTTRQFGNSLSPYERGNLALHVEDNETTVIDNRNYIKQVLNLPSEPFWLNQTHSNTIIHLQTDTIDNATDAAYCREVNKVLCILTADCLPILLCSHDGKEIAAVHAGWRGLANGVIGNSVSAFNTEPNSIIAWIGPAISQKNYEIGTEVREQMLRRIPEGKTCFKQTKPKHFLMDLPKLAELQLHSIGVNHVFQSNLCSYADPKRFYSYRRAAVTGRMASLIWIAES